MATHEPSAPRTDWDGLWRSGLLLRFCFVSLGIAFHAGCENMISTIMPAMVRDIGGVELNGWNFAIYETGSIVAGAAAGRLSVRWPVHRNITMAALIYASGVLATGLAPQMELALFGRLVSGLGGGALISLSFIATYRYFPAVIWPRLIAIESAVWGVAAFGGPLYGGIVSTIWSWRWAFFLLAIMAALYAAASRPVLARFEVASSSPPAGGRFPYVTLAILFSAIMAIAAAGVQDRPAAAAGLCGAGVVALMVFFVRDARNGAARLFPTSPFNPRTALGAGFLMVAALAVSTCSFGFYGPLLLDALHRFSPITTGLIIASESVAWSIMSIAFSGATRRMEPFIVTAGAFMIAGGVAGFAFSIPAGNIALILFFALLQGGGFGLLWPFASRAIVEAAPEGEKELAAAAFSNLQRIGYAIGAAVAGMIANWNGFSGGFTREAAAAATPPLFLGFLPPALVGCVAALRLASRLRYGSASAPDAAISP